MNRDEAFMRILHASTKFQLHIAEILEAKAIEAEKSRHWICNHLHVHSIEQHGDCLKQSGEIQDQLLEVIDGLTKMENALAENLKVLIGDNEEESGGLGAGGSLGDLFSLGGSGNDGAT